MGWTDVVAARQDGTGWRFAGRNDMVNWNRIATPCVWPTVDQKFQPCTKVEIPSPRFTGSSYLPCGNLCLVHGESVQHGSDIARLMR